MNYFGFKKLFSRSEVNGNQIPSKFQLVIQLKQTTMTLALIIGISLGCISILFSRLLKQLDEKAFYALMLSAIGALYVGYTWTDTTSLIINCIQTFFFGTLAYLG